jgi:kinesin family protein 5
MKRRTSKRVKTPSGTERVKVHVRIRPSLPTDGSRDPNSTTPSTTTTMYQSQSQGKVNVITGLNNNGKNTHNTNDTKAFQFDAFFDENTTQEEVYDQVARPIIDGVLDGYNGTLFAYGQTGTGKTYTMMGNEQVQPTAVETLDERGIIPRSLDQIFGTMRASAEEYVYEVSMSYVQLYCELLQDLLEPDFSKTLSIRESAADGTSGSTDSGVFIQGLSSFKVNSKEECLNLLRVGHESRAVAETNMNAQSSRSHAAVVLNVERRPRMKLCTDAADQLLSPLKDKNAPKKTSAKLFIVDLAGSERVRKSGATTGVRFNELKSINLSLSALGNCISALSEKKRHIPFRDSKLTRLLQDSLGGNARTALVINISPCDADAGESLSSLSFGQRAMAVATRAHRNIEVDYKALYVNPLVLVGCWTTCLIPLDTTPF